MIEEHDRVLLALWNEPEQRQWSMPGGGVELEETVEEAAIREIREETGYEVALGRVLGVDSFVLPATLRLVPTDRPLKSVRVLFEARIVGGRLRHEVGGSTDEARWFPLAEVTSLPRVSLVDIALSLRHRPSIL